MAHIKYGGTEVMTSLIVREIVKDRGYDVHMIVGDFDQPKTECIEGVTLHRAFKIRQDFKPLRYLKAGLSLLWLCHKIRADIYFQSAAGFVTGIIGFYCKMSGKKFIYRTASDIDCNGDFIRSQPLAGRLYKYGLFNAHCVITQTQLHQKKLLETFRLRSTVIHNAQALPKENGTVREHILWVGRLVGYKRPLTFVKLASAFPQETFIVIGSGERELEKKILGASKVLPNLKYLRYVPYNSIGDYFRRAKIFVNTSTFEGFPNTFVQSLANGTPILSLTVNPGEILSKHQIGFYCEDSQTSLKRNLKKHINNPELQKELQERSYEYACRNHDLEKIADRYKKLFQGLMHCEKKSD